MKGFFITLEGGEGAGKTTQARHIAQWLEQQGHEVVLTRQPGGTPLAETLREMVLDRDHEDMSPMAELLLLFAGRAQFMEQVVRPALAAGQTVLCDRFTDSTFAYQGGGRGMPLEQVQALADLVHGDLQPDLTLLFDLPVGQGRDRAARRGQADRIEQEELAFFERVRQTYLELASNDPRRFVVIDAAPDSEAVWASIKDALQSRLGT